MPEPLHGLVLTLADGKDYYFAAMKLGPKGDASRAALRQYHNLLTQMVHAEIPAETSKAAVEAALALNNRYDELEDQRLKAFTDLATLALLDNYGDAEAARIAGELIPPDLISVVMQIVKGGQYPENFTPPSSAPTKTA